MGFKEQIKQDIIESLKKGEQVRSLTLRMLLSAMVNKEKEALRPIRQAHGRQAQGKDKELSDEEIQAVVASEAKKRREAMEAYEKGGRPELAAKEKAELEVLFSYLPEQLSEEEIGVFVKEAIQETKAVSIKDMGKVMAVLTLKVKGKADGSLVARIVKESLTAE